MVASIGHTIFQPIVNAIRVKESQSDCVDRTGVSEGICYRSVLKPLVNWAACVQFRWCCA